MQIFYQTSYKNLPNHLACSSPHPWIICALHCCKKKNKKKQNSLPKFPNPSTGRSFLSSNARILLLFFPIPQCKIPCGAMPAASFFSSPGAPTRGLRAAVCELPRRSLLQPRGRGLRSGYPRAPPPESAATRELQSRWRGLRNSDARALASAAERRRASSFARACSSRACVGCGAVACRLPG